MPELIAQLLSLAGLIAQLIEKADTARATDHAAVMRDLADAQKVLATAVANHAARAPQLAADDAAVDLEDAAAAGKAP